MTHASVLAALAPTARQLLIPGPLVNAMPSIWFISRPASSKALRTAPCCGPVSMILCSAREFARIPYSFDGPEELVEGEYRPTFHALR